MERQTKPTDLHRDTSNLDLHRETSSLNFDYREIETQVEHIEIAHLIHTMHKGCQLGLALAVPLPT